MSRIHFNKDDFNEWLQDRNPDKYEIYRTPSRTIAVPTVSTRPVLYGVCEARIPDDLCSIFVEKGFGPVYNVTRFSFSDDEAESR